MNNGGMPNKGTYTALTVISLVLNLLIGIVSLVQMKGMTAAMDSGDYGTAWGKARIIKILTIVACVLTVLSWMIVVNI